MALALTGAPVSPVNHHGSKWSHRKSIESVIRDRGFHGAPSRIVLMDVGPSARAMAEVLRRPGEVADAVEAHMDMDPFFIYIGWKNKQVPDDPVEFAAQFLMLQRISYGGKAVGTRLINQGTTVREEWKLPGFNETSAYGTEQTFHEDGSPKFGKINPLLPAVLRALRRLSPVSADVEIVTGSAEDYDWDSVGPDDLVYVDPPYAHSTGYPNGTLRRRAIKALALTAHSLGATVIVSEAEGLSASLYKWVYLKIQGLVGSDSPIKGKHEEWLTVSPKV